MCLCVCFQDAKKSRLPILIKPSQSLGSVYRLPAAQEVVAQLQAQILELQGELKEFKIRNKQLHQKLILAEAMMEGSPAPDKTLQKGKHLEKCLLRKLDERPIEMSALLFRIAISSSINFMNCSD